MNAAALPGLRPPMAALPVALLTPLNATAIGNLSAGALAPEAHAAVVPRHVSPTDALVLLSLLPLLHALLNTARFAPQRGRSPAPMLARDRRPPLPGARAADVLRPAWRHNLALLQPLPALPARPSPPVHALAALAGGFNTLLYSLAWLICYYRGGGYFALMIFFCLVIYAFVGPAVVSAAHRVAHPSHARPPQPARRRTSRAPLPAAAPPLATRAAQALVLIFMPILLFLLPWVSLFSGWWGMFTITLICFILTPFAPVIAAWLHQVLPTFLMFNVGVAALVTLAIYMLPFIFVLCWTLLDKTF